MDAAFPAFPVLIWAIRADAGFVLQEIGVCWPIWLGNE